MKSKVHIKRFIIWYIIIFGAGATLLVTLFAYLFGLTVIQKNYSRDYVDAVAEEFNTEMEVFINKNNQILFSIISYKSLHDLLSDSTSLDKSDEVQTLLEPILSTYPEIRQVDIISPSSEVYSYISDTHIKETPLSLPSQQFIDSLENTKITIYNHSVSDRDNKKYIVLGHIFKDYMTSFQFGSILLYIDEKAVSTFYEHNFLNDSDICLSNDGTIISSANSDFINVKSSLPIKLKKAEKNYKEDYIYIKKLSIPSVRNNLELIYLISNKDFKQATSKLNNILIILMIITVSGCIVLVLFVVRKLINNINTLKKNLKIFASDYTHTFNVDTSSEIDVLEQQFVDMSDRIRSLITTIESEKELKRIAELKALQSQINPHFIYNSIDSISWMAKLHKPYSDIEKISYNLGRFFRLGLHKGENIITISEELQHVQSYLEIEKIRFPDKFDVCITVKQDLLQLKIIKIILQPLVENAIKHAFKGINKKGMLNINIHSTDQNNGYVIFEVSDNGNGIDFTYEGLPKSNNKEGGYALQNINERLIIEYGEESALQFSSKTDKGTTVQFKIKRSRMI